MNSAQILTLLRINDSLFPTGGFAYSDGLETAATNGLVHDAKSLEQWMRDYIRLVFVPCEGLAVKLAMAADEQKLRELDEELAAIKPSASARSSSATVGRQFLKSVSALYFIPSMDVQNLPIVYGAVCRHFGFSPTDALLAFAYNRLASTTSAALRVMPIGQHQAHGALNRVLEDIPSAIDKIMNNDCAQIRCFAPLLDIQQMNHRYVYSRLFRS